MSKKERAFDLFHQGKRPSDPELKALGLKNKTVYAYYEDFKRKEYGRSVEDAAIDDDELLELKKEKVRLSLVSQIKELEAKQERLPERIDRLGKRVQELIRYLEDILPIIETLAHIGSGTALDHWVEGHHMSPDDLQRWPPTLEAANAIEALKRLGPIAERLRKLSFTGE